MYNMRCYFILTVLVAGFPSLVPLTAQETETAVMTLHDCMEYALASSIDMRVSGADRDDEQSARRQAIFDAFMPSVSASTYVSGSFGRNIDPETNIYSSTSSFYNGYSVSGSIVLFDGFRSVNNMKIAGTAVRMGLSREEQLRDKICLATMVAYYNVLYYSELEKVLSEQVETAELSLRKARRQEELGQKGHAEVVQMESDLAKRRYDLTNVSNQHADALITLKDIMFYPVDEALELAGDAEEDTPLYEDSALTDSGVRELVRGALSSLPEVEESRLSLETAAMQLRTARWAYSPSLTLSGGWSSSYFDYPGTADYVGLPFREQLSANSGEYVQLSLSIPIFDRFSRRTEIARMKNACARAQAEYDRTLRDVENEVRRAVNDRDGAMAAYAQALRLAEVQREAYLLDTRRFEQGLISAIEYSSSSQSYLNAQAERLGARFRYMIKDSVVRYYGGTPYIEQ